MENSNNSGVKGTIILRNWYKSSTQLLTPSEFYQLYTTIFDYSFDGIEPGNNLMDKVAAMWSLIKPAIDADHDKYVARCERNRANALRRSESQRVAASGSESQRVAASGSESQRVGCNINTNANTNANTNNNINNNVVSLEEQRERAIFECLGIFFSRGCVNYIEQFGKFWAYYESLGWKNSKGAPIVSRKSAAIMWACEQVSPKLAGERGAWYAAFKYSQSAPPKIWTIFAGVSRNDDEVSLRLHTDKAGVEYIDEHYQAEMQRFVRAAGGSKLTYKTTGSKPEDITIN